MKNIIIIAFRKQLQQMTAALCRVSMMLRQTLLVSCLMVFHYIALCSIFRHQKEKSILNQDRVREFSSQIEPFMGKISLVINFWTIKKKKTVRIIRTQFVFSNKWKTVIWMSAVVKKLPMVPKKMGQSIDILSLVSSLIIFSDIEEIFPCHSD